MVLDGLGLREVVAGETRKLTEALEAEDEVVTVAAVGLREALLEVIVVAGLLEPDNEAYNRELEEGEDWPERLDLGVRFARFFILTAWSSLADADFPLTL